MNYYYFSFDLVLSKFLFFNFWRTSVFCGTTDNHCFGFLVTSTLNFLNLGWILACVLRRLRAMDSSDSPLPKWDEVSPAGINELYFLLQKLIKEKLNHRVNSNSNLITNELP